MKKFIGEMDKEIAKEFIFNNEHLMVRVNPHKIENTFEHFLIKDLKLSPPAIGFFVKILLKEPLKFILSGIKRPRLKSCACIIPSLNNQKVRSLNQAYMLISQHFEKHRRSHTGNIFHKGYYQDEEDEIWYPLNNLRNKIGVGY